MATADLLDGRYQHILFQKHWEIAPVTNYLLGKCDAMVEAIALPLDPVASRWLHGPARIHGDQVVMDVERAVSYQPLANPKIGLEFMGMRTADDVVAFVERFGLLRSSPHVENPIGSVHEPGAWFLEGAENLRGLVTTELEVRRADDGDAEALARLRQRFRIRQHETIDTATRTHVVRAKPGEALTSPESLARLRLARASRSSKDPDIKRRIERLRELSREPLASKSAADEPQLLELDPNRFLITVSDWVAWRLSDVSVTRARTCTTARKWGEKVKPGILRVGIFPESLIEICYLAAAISLAEKEPLADCPECQRIFVVEDPRQRFCTPACAARARWRRHAPKRKRERHGKKKTRPRRG